MLSQFGRLSFFLCVKISLNKFCPIAFCQHFYFLFCVKDSLNKKNSVCCRAPTACFSPALPPDSPIFFFCVKISLCSRFFPVIYYRFIVAASIYIILFLFSFLFSFFVKTTLILYLTSNFFFLRENHSLFFILFLNKAHFYDGAALLFLYSVFFFFFVKSSLRSLLRSSYIWHCCVPCCSFFCLREIFSQ